jgi:hypothetical protein
MKRLHFGPEVYRLPFLINQVVSLDYKWRVSQDQKQAQRQRDPIAINDLGILSNRHRHQFIIRICEALADPHRLPQVDKNLRGRISQLSRKNLDVFVVTQNVRQLVGLANLLGHTSDHFARIVQDGVFTHVFGGKEFRFVVPDTLSLPCETRCLVMFVGNSNTVPNSFFPNDLVNFHQYAIVVDRNLKPFRQRANAMLRELKGYYYV